MSASIHELNAVPAEGVATPASGGDGEQRAAPQYCPYCGDEDLRPEPVTRRAWHCRSCARVFEVTFVGLKLGAGAQA